MAGMSSILPLMAWSSRCSKTQVLPTTRESQRDNWAGSDIAWAADGSRLWVSVIKDYMAKNTEYRHFVYTLADRSLREIQMPEDYDANTRVFWLDGSRIFFKTTFHMYLYDLDRVVMTDVTDQVWWSHFLRTLFVIRPPG
jgi:hypothetical protein